jgi:hypothetical protein
MKFSDLAPGPRSRYPAGDRPIALVIATIRAELVRPTPYVLVVHNPRFCELIKRLLGGPLPYEQPVVVPHAGPGRSRPDERLTDDELASIAVRLALSFPQWIERRVEHVVYLDDTPVRQRESVTLRWPEPEFFVDEARPRCSS